MGLQTSTACVEFRVTVFHYPQIPALSNIIPPYRAVSFVVVRHHRLGDDYRAAISYRLGLIALSRFGGIYFVATHDAFGLRIGNRFLLVADEGTYTFYICSVI